MTRKNLAKLLHYNPDKVIDTETNSVRDFDHLIYQSENIGVFSKNGVPSITAIDNALKELNVDKKYAILRPMGQALRNNMSGWLLTLWNDRE